MAPPLRTVLFGSSDGPQYVSLALVVAAFGLSFAAYALGVFTVAGGVVFVPGHAALLGALGAVLVGYWRRGLAVGWLVTYGALLGYSADHYFLGLSGRSLTERAGAFFQLDGFVVLGVEALVIGTLGFLIGVCCDRVIALLRAEWEHAETG